MKKNNYFSLNILRMLDYVNDQKTNSSYDTNAFVATLKKITQIEYFNSNVFGQWEERLSLPFSLILTEHGFCFNFNLMPADSLLHLDKVSEDFHYSSDFLVGLDIHEPVISKTPTPWSCSEMKADMYIAFLQSFINKEKNVTYDDSNPFQPLEGFHLIVHNTDELPSFSGYHFFLDYKVTCNLEFRPEMLLIDNDLKRWSPKRRGCILSHEKRLKFFKKYTKRNCELECLSFEILKSCGCVPFYVIRKFELKPQNFWNLLIFMIFRRS